MFLVFQIAKEENLLERLLVERGRRHRQTTPATEVERGFGGGRKPQTTPATVEKRGPGPTGQPIDRELEKLEEILERFLENSDVAKRHPAPTGQPMKRRHGQRRATTPATEVERGYGGGRKPQTTPATVEKRGPGPTGQPIDRELEELEKILERFLEKSDVAKRHPSPTGQPMKRRHGQRRATTPATEVERGYGGGRKPQTTPATVEKRGPGPTGQPIDRELEELEKILERFLENSDVAKRHPSPTGQPMKRR